MIKITRAEFLTFASIPKISNAKEINWFKSKTGDKLAIILQITANHKFDYLIYQQDKAKDYILYPHEQDCSSPDYDAIYQEVEKKMIVS